MSLISFLRTPFLFMHMYRISRITLAELVTKLRRLCKQTHEAMEPHVGTPLFYAIQAGWMVNWPVYKDEDWRPGRRVGRVVPTIPEGLFTSTDDWTKKGWMLLKLDDEWWHWVTCRPRVRYPLWKRPVATCTPDQFLSVILRHTDRWLDLGGYGRRKKGQSRPHFYHEVNKRGVPRRRCARCFKVRRGQWTYRYQGAYMCKPCKQRIESLLLDTTVPIPQCREVIDPSVGMLTD